MAKNTENKFTHYHVHCTPGGAPVRVLVRLDDGSTGEQEYIAGYLKFWEVPDERLPDDEQSPVSGYIVKNMPVERLETVLDLLHRQIDVLKRQMIISGSVDASGKLRTWLSTTQSPTNKEMTDFFSGNPSISSLDPNTVEQGWEGTVKIHGSGFDSGSFALFSGTVPRATYKSASLLEAEVKKNITDTAGTKKVKVHTGGGSVSNEVDFVVKPKSA